MSLDPHHVHNFWGVSPALDLCDVVRRCRADQATAEEEAPPDASDAPFSALLVGTNDPRHIVTTLARARRHFGPALGERSLKFHVYESTMAEAARHVLLLCVLMSDDLPPSERVERFLEIFMNATLRESTAELGTRTSTVSGDASAYAAACGSVSCSVASSTRRSEPAESLGCTTAPQPNGCTGGRGTKPPSSASVGA